jgi:hypothetical protein
VSPRAFDHHAQWIARKLHLVRANVRQPNDEVIHGEINDHKGEGLAESITHQHFDFDLPLRGLVRTISIAHLHSFVKRLHVKA